MSKVSQPPRTKISDWLNGASRRLKDATIPSARLDAELILSHTLRHGRTYLHAHPDEILDPALLDIAEARLGLREERTPLAYIIGHKEFYGRNFKVTPAVLIPRPESEASIDLLKRVVTPGPLFSSPERMVDVGCGSGNLGITAKLELPYLDVTLIDTSEHALNVARENADRLDAEVRIERGNLLSRYPYKANYIVANLPYLDGEWYRSPETSFEPAEALFADDNGLGLIKKLIEQANSKLAPDGYVILEADQRQHLTILDYAAEHGLKPVGRSGLALCFQKNAQEE